jgi:hypothetical protein
MKRLVTFLVLAIVLLTSSTLLAHGYVAYMPVGPVPVATYYAPAAPVVTYGPVVAASYYAPAPYYAAPAPYYVAAPVVAAPVVAPYYAAPMAVAPVYGRPAIVHPKVYYPGQPVRNVLRAVTP